MGGKAICLVRPFFHPLKSNKIGSSTKLTGKAPVLLLLLHCQVSEKASITAGSYEVVQGLILQSSLRRYFQHSIDGINALFNDPLW